jgi:hypothetical protein
VPGADRKAQHLASAAWVLLLVAAIPAYVAFDAHRGLAGMGDDSVSYLVQAQLYAGSASPAVRAWAGTATHFPPFFPLLLAAAGASHDFLRAHLVVAACAVLALGTVFAAVARITGDRPAACAVVAAFLLTPSAWIHTLGILSDPPYLLLSFAALALQPAAREPGRARLAGFSLLLVLCVLTRSAGLALVLAYAVHAGIRAMRREPRAWALATPLALVALAGGVWIALRVPLVGENYGLVLRNVAAWIGRDPAGFFEAIGRQLGNGWIASFTADPAVSAGVRAFYLVVAALAVAGAVRAAARNRLDGWYALAYAAMLCVWLFPHDIMRRLVYPLLPLAILHAGEVLWILGRRASPTRAWMAPGIAAILSALLAAPALVTTAERATDRTPPLAGSALDPAASALDLAGMTPYYTIVADAAARAKAGGHLAVLAGLDEIARRTPPDARVMWMRPDYVALLGDRTAVPWFFREGLAGTLARMEREGVTHVVVAAIVKGDLHGEGGEEFITTQALAPFARGPAYTVQNPVRPGEEFRLVAIDRAALAAYLARGGH